MLGQSPASLGRHRSVRLGLFAEILAFASRESWFRRIGQAGEWGVTRDDLEFECQSEKVAGVTQLE